MTVQLIFQHFWLLAIAVTAINALILHLRSRAYIREQPDLAPGYRRLVLGVLFWGSLPWLVMGCGIIFGGVPNIFSYFHPRDSNPFILGWYGVIIAIWLLGFYWLFARNGAEFLIKHPGLLQGQSQNPNTIYRTYCLIVAGGIAGLCIAYFTGLRIPGQH